jgi:hypothetical protein
MRKGVRTALALFISILFLNYLLNSSLISQENFRIKISSHGGSCYSPSLNEKISLLFHGFEKKFNQTKSSVPQTLIVTSSDAQYRGILLNWMYSMKLLDIQEYLILCFDQKTFDLVGDWNDHYGHGILIQDCQSKNQKFEIRHQIANIILQNNDTVILSDCDSLWLQDFRSQWIQPFRRQVDLIAQIGTHPIDVSKRYGYAVCAGLMVLFPTHNTIRFYQKLLERFHEFELSSEEIDDQSLINHLLESFHTLQPFDSKINHLPSISEMESSYRRNNGTLPPLHHPRDPFLHLPNSSSSNLQLGLFPFNSFPRILPSSDRLALQHYYRYFSQYCPSVWHLKPPFPHPSAHIYQLQQSKLFQLDSKWKDIKSFPQVQKYFHYLSMRSPIKNNEDHC